MEREIKGKLSSGPDCMRAKQRKVALMEHFCRHGVILRAMLHPGVTSGLCHLWPQRSQCLAIDWGSCSDTSPGQVGVRDDSDVPTSTPVGTALAGSWGYSYPGKTRALGFPLAVWGPGCGSRCWMLDEPGGCRKLCSLAARPSPAPAPPPSPRGSVCPSGTPLSLHDGFRVILQDGFWVLWRLAGTHPQQHATTRPQFSPAPQSSAPQRLPPRSAALLGTPGEHRGGPGAG